MSKKTYHVFTNNTDEWFDNLEEAEKLHKEFILECGISRVYEEERDEDGEVLSENCILSFGEYPQ